KLRQAGRLIPVMYSTPYRNRAVMGAIHVVSLPAAVLSKSLLLKHFPPRLGIGNEKSRFWKLTQRRFIKGYTQAGISRSGEQQSNVTGFAPTVAANVDVSTQNSALTWLGRQEDCISAVRRSLDRRGGRMRIQRRRVFCDDSRSLDVYAPAARSASGR